MLPIGKVFGNGFDGLELRARENQRVADRRVEEKDQRKQEACEANVFSGRSSARRLDRLPLGTGGFVAF
jgi:hypothetical protein